MVAHVVTCSSYSNALHYRISMFVELEKLPDPSVIPIVLRFVNVIIYAYNLYGLDLRKNYEIRSKKWLKTKWIFSCNLKSFLLKIMHLDLTECNVDELKRWLECRVQKKVKEKQN